MTWIAWRYVTSHAKRSAKKSAAKALRKIGFDQVDIERATAYAEDADITLQLHLAMWPQVEHDNKLRFIYDKIECQLLSCKQKIERKWVLIDRDLLATQPK